MRSLITAQQTSFFAQNGYIEFEGIPFDSEEIFATARASLASRAPKNATPIDLYAHGRDLWRDAKPLQTLLLRKLGPIALALTGKTLRLACDQWIPAHHVWENASAFKELFCIQGLALGGILCSTEVALPSRAPLGLLPLPKQPGSVLFLKPNLLIDWPGLAKSPATDLYFFAYSLQNAVYVYNSKDPSTYGLKLLGYNFGDVLQNKTHPLLTSP